MDIVEILKVGFSGFSFLLAGLAYKLLSESQKNKSLQKNQLYATYSFMVFSIILAILTLFAPLMPKFLEEKPDLFMQAVLQSTKNRKPLPIEFVKSQIFELTIAHNKRVNALHAQREAQERALRNKAVTDEDVRNIEKALRRIEQYIRIENRDYDRKVSDFRRML